MNAGSWRLAAQFRTVGALYIPTGAAAGVQNNQSEGTLQQLAYGTSTAQINLISSLSETLAASASVTLNLYDGSVLDIFGQPAPFRHLRSLAIWVSAGGDSSGVTISPGASNGNLLWWTGTTPTKTIYPGGPPELGGNDAGVVVDATHNTVKILNNGAVGVTVLIGLAGSTV